MLYETYHVRVKAFVIAVAVAISGSCGLVLAEGLVFTTPPSGTTISLAPGELIEGVKALTPEELAAGTGIKDLPPSAWRMVIRGAWLEPYFFQAKWADINSFGMSRASIHKLFVGPYEQYPFYYGGELCNNVFGGFVDLNYEPWYPGAEHIVEAKTTIGGVLFISDPDFLLYLQFTSKGLVYVSGRGTARYRSGKVIDLGSQISAATWKHLASSGTGVAREGGLTALGYLKDKESIPLLAAALSDTSTLVRIKAVESLGRIGGKEVVEPLIKAIEDKDEWVRCAAGEALGTIRTNAPTAVAALVSLVGKATDVNSPREAEVAIWSLQKIAGFQESLSANTDPNLLEIDKKTLASLYAWAKDSSVKSRRAMALRACALVADKDAEELLEGAVSDKEERDRGEVVVLYALRKAKASLPKLKIIVQDESEEAFLRRLAAWMVGRVGKAEGVEFLSPYLNDQTESTLLVGVVLGMGQSGSPKAAQLLGAFYDKAGSDNLKVAVAESLSMMGSVAADQMRPLAQAEIPAVRYHVVKGLAASPSDSMTDLLVAALSDELGPIRGAAVKGLESLKWSPRTLRDKALYALASGKVPNDFEAAMDDNTVKAIQKGLEDSEWKGRCVAAEILGKSRNPSAMAGLVKALSDGDILVRQKAAKALDALGWTPNTDGEHTQYLIALMDFEGCAKQGAKAAPILVEALIADHGCCCQWISEALVKNGPASIQPLCARIETKYSDHAKWICQTLVELGDASQDALVKVLSDGSVKEKMWAARTIRNLGDARALPALRAALASIPEPKKTQPGGGLVFKPMTGSQWDRDEQTPEGDARRAIQFAINALDRSSAHDK